MKNSNDPTNKFHDRGYYLSNEFNIKNPEYLRQEKIRLKTKEKKADVTSKLESLKESYKSLKKNKNYNPIFTRLKLIYEQNKNYAFRKPNSEMKEPINSDLFRLVTDRSMIRLAYNRVKRNKCATTQAKETSVDEFMKMNEEQQEFLRATENLPHGFSENIITLAINALTKEEYPWGTSRRTYIEKPGKPGSKRPLTIPPFMDKVIQEVIKIILTAVYEPYMDKMNVSFGFRANKGVQDAIHSLTNYNATGMKIAIEGDIKAAYDKDLLIKILGKKIKDRKFLNLIKNRLDYTFFDEELKEYLNKKLDGGVPQGGADSPYLWNIYMMEFDEYIINEIINKFVKDLNEKARGKNKDETEIVNPTHKKITAKKTMIKRLYKFIRMSRRKNRHFLDILKTIVKKKTINININMSKVLIGKMKTFLKDDINIDKHNDEKTFLSEVKKAYDKLKHKQLKMNYYKNNKIKFRLIYSRYADDWIILTNMHLDIVQGLKEKIRVFLLKLKATLSDEKTLITDIRKNGAHYLGFKIKAYKKHRIMKIQTKNKHTKVKKRTTTGTVFAIPDNERLLIRMNMKGYCNKKGFPTEIRKLATLDVFSIIERYNSVLRGITNFYYNFIRNPKSRLNRWIYILRYSCLKTIAQKHKSTINKIFKKYKSFKKTYEKQRTIEYQTMVKVNKITLSKTWRLLTREELHYWNTSQEMYQLKENIIENYNKLQKGEPVEYPENTRFKTSVTNIDFLERATKINMRTACYLSMPCSICGSYEKVEVHHIRAIRKTPYYKFINYLDMIMSHKNRKQIPICRTCHIKIVHAGKYDKTNPRELIPVKLYDNRTITLQPARPPANPEIMIKKMLEKGYKIINAENNLVQSS